MISKIEEVEVEKILLPEEEINSPLGNDGYVETLHSNRTRSSFHSRCWYFFGNIGKMKTCFNKTTSMKTICNGDIKESVDICENEVVPKSGNGGHKKWVAVMLIVGILDLILSLTKFAMCSESEETTPRLTAGYLDQTSVSKNDLWLPLCIFTIVGTILFFPEFANTLSALFRIDGTTSVSLHVELLITLIFKHVPLATISYFTSKWWTSQVAGNAGSVLEGAVTSSRLLFVSLRIVWYAHMEGIKVRKNDKYELKQVLFMFCCLLFSVTIAIPVMTLKLNKDENKLNTLTECSDISNLWITATWEDSCLMAQDDSSNNHAFNDWQPIQGDEVPWKVYTSQSNDPNHKFHLQKCLNISVCDLFKSTYKEYLVVYQCHSFISEVFSFEMNMTSKVPPTLPRMCYLGMNRFIIRFYYHSFLLASDSDDVGKKRRSLKPKDNSRKAVTSETNSSTIDVILYTVAGFCTNNPHECLLFDSKTIESHKNESEKTVDSRGSYKKMTAVNEQSKHNEESPHDNLFKFISDSDETFLGDLKPRYADHRELEVEDSCLLYLKLEGFQVSQKSRKRRTSWMCSN